MRLGRLIIAAVAGAAIAGGAFAQQANWPKSLTLGTASVGGTFAIYGPAWANIVSEALKVNISTQNTQGPNQNVILVDKKDIELGMTTMGVAYEAWEGQGDWTKGQKFRNIRALFPMYDTSFHFVTLERSGIKSVKDMQGKSVGVGPRAGTPGTYFPRIFKDFGINVTIRNGSGADMSAQLADGLIDVFAFASGIPIAAFSEVEATNAVRFVTFSDEEIKKLLDTYPELSPSVVPANTYRTLKEDHKTVGMFNFAIAHKDLPEDLAYGIVKTVLENHDRMVQAHSAAKETLIENWNKNTFLPFHPGAIKYFREKGIAVPDKLVPQG